MPVGARTTAPYDRVPSGRAVSPPLRKGRALASQRLAGLLFLAVIAGLVLLTVALYQKRFAPVVMVDFRTGSVGNQLSAQGDVKVRGLRVGEIRSIETTGDGATVRLAIDEDMAPMVPVGTVGRLLPKTLFGEKFVSLVTPQTGGRPVQDGDLIEQDDSVQGIETEEVLDDALPLLQALKPDDLSRTLNALSGALRGRGERIGENAELVDAYLKRFNPALPELQENLRGIADLADTYDDVAPDLLAVLDDLSFSSRSLVDQEDELGRFLGTSTRFAGTFDEVLRENEDRLVRLAADSRPVLGLFARYSPEYACLARGLAQADDTVGRTFGGLQPGLHITLETTPDQGGYVPGDEPVYGDETGPSCRGLPGSPTFPERPFPVYREAEDGYCDEFERRPGNQSTEPCPRGESSAAQAQAQAEHDLLALVTSPVLGVPAEEVGDLADLLFGPMARGTQVSLGR